MRWIWEALALSRCHQDALARTDAKGLSRAQHFVVDRVEGSADFESIGTRVWRGGFFGQRIVGIRCLCVLIHGGQEGLPFTQCEKDLLVVTPRVIRGIDHEKTKLAGVGAAMQIEHGLGVRVVPPRSCRLGNELIAPAPMRWDRRCTFFLRSINIRGNEQTVPMHVFRNIRVVDDFHTDALALSHAQ